jgi:hypothetical protein
VKPSFRNLGRGLVIAGAAAALVVSAAGVSSAATTPTDTHRVTIRGSAPAAGANVYAGLNSAVAVVDGSRVSVVQGVYVSVNAPRGSASTMVTVALNGVTKWRRSMAPGHSENLGLVVNSGRRFVVTVSGAGRTLVMYGYVVAGTGASKGSLVSFGSGRYYDGENQSVPVIYVNGTGVGVSNYGPGAAKLGNTVFVTVRAGGQTCDQVLTPRVGNAWDYLAYGNGNFSGTLSVRGKNGKLVVTDRFAGWLPLAAANNN